jgi:putative transposase
MTFSTNLQALGIKKVLSAPHAPWQRAYIERVIGSIRRECLDHVIVLNEASLRRTIQSYIRYYHDWRTHLSLNKDAPVPRATQPLAAGTIVQVPHVGGLHHHYERHAA